MLRKTETGVHREELGEVWRELSEYIDKNLNSKLTLSALAGKCFYNPSYFSRAFKKKFGVSLTEYIRGRRIEKARLLLETEDASVEEIMSRVGFSDRSAFYHALTEACGMTPAEYRSAFKGKKSIQSE